MKKILFAITLVTLAFGAFAQDDEAYQKYLKQ